MISTDLFQQETLRFQTRMAEIRQELLKSRRLDAYFEKNPRERWALEQDRKQYKLNVYSSAIADVPDYIGNFERDIG